MYILLSKEMNLDNSEAMHHTTNVSFFFTVHWGVCQQEGIVRVIYKYDFVYFGERWDVCHACRYLYVYEDSTRHACRKSLAQMRIRTMEWGWCLENRDAHNEYIFRKELLQTYSMSVQVLQASRVHPGCNCVACQVRRDAYVPYTGLPTNTRGLFL